MPAEQIENSATQEYQALLRQAASKRALAPADDPQVQRLRRIADQLIPHVKPFNARAVRWQWEINLIGSKQINAFCMPGGKIAFYTGLVDGLKLTDDEIAADGARIAHALREHARTHREIAADLARCRTARRVRRRRPPPMPSASAATC